MGKRVVTHVVSLYLEEYSYYSSCMLLNIYSSNILIFPFIFYFDFILFRFHFSYDNENYHLLKITTITFLPSLPPPSKRTSRRIRDLENKTPPFYFFFVTKPNLALLQ